MWLGTGFLFGLMKTVKRLMWLTLIFRTFTLSNGASVNDTIVEMLPVVRQSSHNYIF